MKIFGLLAALCCLSVLALGACDAIDQADQVTHTYFRPQEMLMSYDNSTEENIPGLDKPDLKSVQAAIPNLEHLAPFLTILSPFLPSLYEFTNELGIYLPHSWPLAETGPSVDWLQFVVRSFWDGLWGLGPRPQMAPTLMIAAPEAYKKLAGDLIKYSGLPPLPKLLLVPGVNKLIGFAVIDQLANNMQLPAAPMLSTAANGTIVKTAGGAKLTLVVKEDGRYLVSNTTTAKILKGDIRQGPHTFLVVDSFIVPKISLKPRAPPPLLNDEETKRLPELMQMMRESMKEMPKAIRAMPGAWSQMLKQQMPDELQGPWSEAEKKLSEKLGLPMMTSLSG